MTLLAVWLIVVWWLLGTNKWLAGCSPQHLEGYTTYEASNHIKRTTE